MSMAKLISRLQRLKDELQRRHVFRVAAMYGVVAFVVLQAAELLLPGLLLPEWTYRLLVALVLFGFPIALVLAWAFDLTPEGVVRTPALPTDDAPPAQSPATATAAGTSPAGGGDVAGALVAAQRRGSRAMAYVGVGVLLALVGFGLSTPFLERTPDLVGEESPAAAPGLDRAIAVLPFANLSTDRENEYFSDGITEDITAALANVADLRVVSRTTSMRYRNSDLTLRQIGQELEVGWILEGSVRREGDQVRITSQLINARTDEHLWGKTYDREMTGVFRVQSEIAQEIAAALQARLSPEEEQGFERRLVAHNYYLRGRDFFLRLSPRDNETAITLYQEALDLEPAYGLALASLAEALAARARWSGEDAWLDSAAIVASRALDSDPRLAEGHAALAAVHAAAGRLGQARDAFQRALDLRPDDVHILVGAAVLDRDQGRLAEALARLERALTADPASGLIAGLLADVHLRSGDLGSARRRAEESLSIGPDQVQPYRLLAYLDLLQGRPDRASERIRSMLVSARDEGGAFIAAVELTLASRDTASAALHLAQAQRLFPDGAPGLALEASFLAEAAGEHERARQLLAAAEEALAARAGNGDVSSRLAFDQARAAALRGNISLSLDRMSAAVERGFREFHAARLDAILAPVRADPRYDEIVG